MTCGLGAGFDRRKLQKMGQQDLSLPEGNFPKRFKHIAGVLRGLGWRQFFQRRSG